jgi:signal transduction histidine kinase
MMAMESHGETLTEIPIDYDIPRDLPLVLGNPTQLTQVLINFFRNAQHAMNEREEKKITVTARVDPAAPDLVEIRFADNGTGIRPEVLPRIFDFQFTTKGDKGHGIGLNQCKLIIEKFFKGSIECESRLGEGTTFILRIPVWREEMSHAEGAAGG